MSRLVSPNFVRTAIVALAVLAAGLSAVNLARSIPWQSNVARYWDDAALIQGIQNDGYPTGESVVIGEYAILKLGYALPFWCLYHWTSADPALVLGLTWFLVMLVAPLFTSLFRDEKGIAWTGWTVWAAAMLSFPIIHKYIGMANPTIQSMALWLLLALFYGKHRAGQFGWMVAPGIICGLLVVTDYKWLTFCIVSVGAVEICELWISKTADKPVVTRHNGLLLLRRVGMALAWMSCVVAIAALSNAAYFASIIKYVTGPGRIDAFRPALSWNLLIFLWVLGGFWALLWTAWRQWARRHEDLLRGDDQSRLIRRVLIVGLVIAVGFTVLFWPRSARMFAPAIALGLLLFATLAYKTISSQSDSQRNVSIASALLLLIVAGMAYSGSKAGDYYRTPDGVREMADYIHAHSDRIPPQQVGSYVPPVFRIAVGGGYEWVFLASSVPQTLDWAVTSEVLDRVIIDEQHLFGNRPWQWRPRAYEIRENLGRTESPLFSIRNDFYSSPYYLCESNYSDAELTFVLDQAAKVENSTWDLRYVGILFGRAVPEMPRP